MLFYGVCLGAAVSVVVWVVVRVIANNIGYARQARQNVLNRLADRLTKLEWAVGPSKYVTPPDTSVNGRLITLEGKVDLLMAAHADRQTRRQTRRHP